MKKFFCAMLAAILALIPISVTAQCNENALEQDISLSDIHNSDYFSESVLTLNSSEINTIDDNIDSVKTFIDNGGILVVNNDVDNTVSLCQDLDMQIEPELLNSDDQTNNSVPSNVGTDIATLYYNYGNGFSGIYIINVQNDVTNAEKEELMDEAINVIQDIQNSYSTPDIQPLASSTKKTLGKFTYTSTCLPKGKLTLTYEFFTVQNYNGKDYYTVKAQVVGIPGSTLASSNSNYKSKYHGLSQKTAIKTTTSSVTIDAYGPERIDKNSSYTVSVGTSFNENSGTTFGANFNYTKQMPETDIEATRTTTQATWNVSLSGGARTSTSTFVPAVTFVCPDSKSSINITLSSDYVVDSWDTFKETISATRNVKCEPTKSTEL